MFVVLRFLCFSTVSANGIIYRSYSEFAIHGDGKEGSAFFGCFSWVSMVHLNVLKFSCKTDNFRGLLKYWHTFPTKSQITNHLEFLGSVIFLETIVFHLCRGKSSLRCCEQKQTWKYFSNA